MITVITRLYNDEASARGVRGRLLRLGFPKHVTSVITPGDAPDAVGLRRRIEHALVPGDKAAAIAKEIADGASLVVVRASYKPLNAVRLANETFESSGSVPSALTKDPIRVKDPFDPAPSILKDHPLLLTTLPDPKRLQPTVSEWLGLRLLSDPRRRDSVLHPSKRYFGDGLRRSRKQTSLKTGRYMSSYFWPTPLISRKERRLSILAEGGHPLSRLLGWRTIHEETKG